MKTNTTFDVKEFIDSLIYDMGMKDEDPEKVKILRDGIEKQINEIMLNTASLYTDPEVIDMILEEYKDQDDLAYLCAKLIEYSPRVQLEIFNALDDFRNQTMEAYNFLKS
jgi:hypothetical protein